MGLHGKQWKFLAEKIEDVVNRSAATQHLVVNWDDFCKL